MQLLFLVDIYRNTAKSFNKLNLIKLKNILINLYINLSHDAQFGG